MVSGAATPSRAGPAGRARSPPVSPATALAKGKGGRKAANPYLSDDERRRERVLKNRESAMKSLQKKKRYTEDLEARAAVLHARNDELKIKIRSLLARLSHPGMAPDQGVRSAAPQNHYPHLPLVNTAHSSVATTLDELQASLSQVHDSSQHQSVPVAHASIVGMPHTHQGIPHAHHALHAHDTSAMDSAFLAAFGTDEPDLASMLPFSPSHPTAGVPHP
jgi:hypothetical protein